MKVGYAWCYHILAVGCERRVDLEWGILLIFCRAPINEAQKTAKR